MPKILIIARHNDDHLLAVKWGLTLLGNPPSIWYWDDFPKDDIASIWVNNDSGNKISLISDRYETNESFDVIWVRRRVQPTPMALSHPDDLDIICTESNHFLDSILPFLGHTKTRWVNHPDADSRTRNKLNQLHIAKAIGFKIPDTLMGNDINAARRFFSDHPEGIIHKSFAPHSWGNINGSRIASHTAVISEADLVDEFPVRSCPSIYQANIPKKHELRVTVIGQTILASLIDSQRDGKTTDWRYEGGRGRDNLHYIELSARLKNKCLLLCHRLGLVFGCIDLIVNPSGEEFFLEINCAGQFLFNEHIDKEIPMLDTFCKYLINNNHFYKKDENVQLRFTDFLKFKALHS